MRSVVGEQKSEISGQKSVVCVAELFTSKANLEPRDKLTTDH